MKKQTSPAVTLMRQTRESVRLHQQPQQQTRGGRGKSLGGFAYREGKIKIVAIAQSTIYAIYRRIYGKAVKQMACKYHYQHPDKNKFFCRKDGRLCPFKIPNEYKCLKAIQEDNENRGRGYGQL